MGRVYHYNPPSKPSFRFAFTIVPTAPAQAPHIAACHSHTKIDWKITKVIGHQINQEKASHLLSMIGGYDTTFCTAP